MRLDIKIPWKPHAKQRPRVANGHAYTPKATRDAEARILAAVQAELATSFEKFDGPIAVEIGLSNDHFYLSVTECDDYKERKLRGDIDNYAKTILDSLNGVVWEDDKQIGYLEMRKL